MRIKIETIPHAQQRYPTCGDWYFTPEGDLVIKVSEEIGVQSAGLVALHELVEVFLCSNGLAMTQADKEALTAKVDEFDKGYTGDLVEEEPGDDPKAPYHIEHSIATAVERLLAAKLGIAWKDHDGRVANLFE